MTRYIQPIPSNSANGLVARVYSQIKTDFGILAEPFVLHSLLPELLASIWSVFRESMLIGSARRETKEAVAVTISKMNVCPYCVEAHEIMLNVTSGYHTGPAISHGHDDQIPDAEVRSIIAWASATRSPGSPILLSPPFSRKDTP